MKNKGKTEYILEYDMVLISIVSLILMVFMFGLTFLLFNITSNNFIFEFNVSIDNGNFKAMLDLILIFILFFAWMILHEIIHGIAYKLKGVNKSNIVYGAALEHGVFYCKCREYIDKKSIMFSLLAPFFVIGVFTYILGFLFNLPLLILLSIINISGAAGDLVIYFFFLRQKDDVEFKELGFSSPFCIRTDDDLTKNRYLGIKSIRKVKDSKETYEEYEGKLIISKPTYVYFGITLFILIAGIILLFVN